MYDFALTALASILFVVDPVGAVPGYLAMTEGDDARKRTRTAWKASLAAAVVMAVFAAAGEVIFRLLGLTMPAFRVAGGLILFLVALDMLRAQRPTQEQPEELSEGRSKDDVALTPLAIPMLAGPASLSTVATLMSQAHGAAEAAVVYAAIGLAAVVTGFTLQLASPLHRLLGKTGIHVLTRVFGLLLAAIAVQFVLEGLRSFAFDALRSSGTVVLPAEPR
jgi:multiple antibiotic resistance protein